MSGRAGTGWGRSLGEQGQAGVGLSGRAGTGWGRCLGEQGQAGVGVWESRDRLG